ncbi:helix-turn-helix transcriptional regulator [Cryobacterium sp. SO2]|uniref:helix-turn-helix transcriptional regulator n=1 Tax=Cryobacterium sp. SO2 TaxID=1897060 RepID=UPI00223DBC67|nr:helix-turn-helix transcriptional regulator [Cryobacterium sp. SO2]WEO77374.1 helix-turn-helix transcriptional regulator [Cryobacterium sp. SO2]
MSTQSQNEVRDFLTSRRARVRPEQVDLPGGPNRRVPGLRRGEVAMLANVSIEYYAKLERGNLTGVSATVLDSIAHALLLDDAERDHLLDLARAANESPATQQRRSSRAANVRPALQFILDSYTGGPAFVRNGRLDILGANALGRALYVDLFRVQPHPANLARFAFLDRPHAELFYPNWKVAAEQSVAILRTEAGRDPHNTDLHDLIGELSTLSEDFRSMWGAHNVRRHAAGRKYFHHPIVGDLDLVFEGAELVADPGLSLLLYSAEPGTSSETSLKLLASWAATHRLDASAVAGHAGT